MRRRPGRYCRGCGRPVGNEDGQRGAMCDGCKKQSMEDRRISYNRKASHENTIGRYGAGWKRRRDRYIKRNPLCEPCLARGSTTPASQVDHVVPYSLGGEDRVCNYQSICDSCHRTKSAYEGILSRYATRKYNKGYRIRLRSPDDALLWGLAPRSTLGIEDITMLRGDGAIVHDKERRAGRSDRGG